MAGQSPEHGIVAVHQGLEQHLGQLFRGESRHAATPATGLAVTRHVRFVGIVSRRVARLAGVHDRVLRASQREVDLEHHFEGPPVGVVLDQRGAQGVLEGFPVLQRDMGDRLHGVQVLGQADREARFAEFGDEPAQEVQQRLVGRRFRRRCGNGHRPDCSADLRPRCRSVRPGYRRTP